MSDINQIINSLSDEELEILNSDPEMLASFRQKYANSIEANPLLEAAKSATSEALFMPGTISRKLATDPVTQAKALPHLLGTVGAIAPVPMGTTMGTVGGRQLSNLALASYGRADQIPSLSEQALEGGLSIIGDLTAIPAFKRLFYGKQIGKAEKAAGVISRAPEKLPTPGTLGEVLNTLESQLDSGVINSPQTAKDAKEIADFIWSPRNEVLLGYVKGAKVQAARIAEKAQDALNRLVPGRREPAKRMARSLAAPRTIGKVYGKIPAPIRRTIKWGANAGLGFEVARRAAEGLLGR